MTLRWLLTCCLCVAAFAGGAQTASLKSPDEFLSYKLGSRFTEHHRLVEYFRFIDQQSPRVNLIEYGRTYEGRPLIAAIITSEANMSRLEELRLNNLRRTGLESGRVTADEVVFVHLSYSVHGNEAAGAESSMAVLYDLVSDSEQANDWLARAVVILDPCLNPDGYARFSQWSNSVSSVRPNPNPITREHQENWPSGRSNHYQFDLNRDWAWLTQQESRARLAFYLQWMPHVHADVHEFTGQAPYYFPPAARPYHPYLTPWQVEFQEMAGRNHARYFDAKGWGYFTKERYDLFYPAYGDTYPAYAGAIGMTYEQGGGGLANLAVLRENGDTLTLADRIAHHRVASLSTVEISAMHAARLVREFEAYYRQSMSDPAGTTSSYVLSAENHPAKLNALVALLHKHLIRYGAAASDRAGVKAFGYREGQQVNFDVQKGDLVIPAAQPRGVLARILFDPQATLEDSLTYDITAWSLPMAYGLVAYATESSIATETWIHQEQPRRMLEPYAYALEWGSMASVRLVAGLMRDGVVARYAREAFGVGGSTYPAGTILLMQADNQRHSGFHQRVQETLARSEVRAGYILTGFVESGKDLGSYAYPLLRVPRILSLSGPSVSAYSMGEIWHYFDELLSYPVDFVDTEDLAYVSLSDYNVLVLPEGYYSLAGPIMEELNAWISEGGIVIALGSANQKLAGKPGFDLKYQSNSRDDSVRREEIIHSPDVFGSEDRSAISDDIPGAVFTTRQDTTHPLTFGLGKPYFTLKTSPSAFAKLPRAGNAIWLDKDPVHYGFVGYRARARMDGTLVAGRQDKGSGHVVYLVDNPLFRSFWYDGQLLFANALFFN